MCGIVGADLTNPTEHDLEILKNVFLETEIRGKHASGFAWFTDKINIVKKPIPISEHIKEIDFSDMVYNNKLKLIGHIRYSTSDIEYNQPIGDETSAIVHNGIISQEDPSVWNNKYGYSCNTKNDSELLLHAIRNGDDYFKKFNDPSISALYMDSTGTIKNIRNGLRPQWIATINSGILYASTFDILQRAGVPVDCIFKVDPQDNSIDKQNRTTKH